MAQNLLESKAARLADRRLEWNELDFVGWKEFRRMAPAVVGLEIGRLDRLISEEDIGGETYNALVAARFALRKFADGLEDSERDTLDERSEHLRRALLSVSILKEALSDERAETLQYVLHRLSYINNRMNLVY